VGPRLLLANGYERTGAMECVSLPFYAVLALIAVGWSMCSGVLVLQAAFASGYFLA
jgi:type III secretory pathway component EscR